MPDIRHVRCRRGNAVDHAGHGVDAVDQPVLPGLVADDERFGLGGRLQFQANPVRDSHMCGCEPGVACNRLPTAPFMAGGVKPARPSGVHIAIVDKRVIANADIEGGAAAGQAVGITRSF